MRPKIRPVSAEAAAAGQAAIDSFNNIFIPEGAESYPTKNGTGRRWSARLSIEKARVGVGGTKDEPNENVAVYYLMTKALPLNVAPQDAVPVGTTYHLNVRVDNDKIADGDEMAIRNEAVLTTLFSALGVDVKSEGLSEDIIMGAFPERGNEAKSTILGRRVVATLSASPGKDGGRTFLNVDRFLPDVEG